MLRMIKEGTENKTVSGPVPLNKDTEELGKGQKRATKMIVE